MTRLHGLRPTTDPFIAFIPSLLPHDHAQVCLSILVFCLDTACSAKPSHSFPFPGKALQSLLFPILLVEHMDAHMLTFQYQQLLLLRMAASSYLKPLHTAAAAAQHRPEHNLGNPLHDSEDRLQLIMQVGMFPAADKIFLSVVPVSKPKNGLERLKSSDYIWKTQHKHPAVSRSYLQDINFIHYLRRRFNIPGHQTANSFQLIM